MDQVAHLHTAFHRTEKVLMMPESIRPKALFIYKVGVILHMGYFCNPMHRNQTKQTDPVAYNHTRIHAVAGTKAGQYFKAELGWGNAVEIGG